MFTKGLHRWWSVLHLAVAFRTCRTGLHGLCLSVWMVAVDAVVIRY